MTEPSSVSDIASVREGASLALSPPRYASSQIRRTLVHPTLPQDKPEQKRERARPASSPAAPAAAAENVNRNDEEIDDEDKETKKTKERQDSTAISHCFVVCADTQLGMTSRNREWETELEYSRRAIEWIHNRQPQQPKPLFCCVCGDLVDMTASIYAARKTASEISGVDEQPPEQETQTQSQQNKQEGLSWEECEAIQDAQNADFQSVWNHLDPDIALVCVCGNHDVGNRPTATTIQKFKSTFGDDYLAFWAKTTYNIVLNTALISDPTDAMDQYQEQMIWLQQRLEYANQHDATAIFVFGHHPWFLYHENETESDLMGCYSPNPVEWGGPAAKPDGFVDSYFHIPLERRKLVLELFRQHGVTAAFCGHFHQNVISYTSWGMPVIVTSSLSLVFESTGIAKHAHDSESLTTEVKGSRGLRWITVQDNGTFIQQFYSIV